MKYTSHLSILPVLACALALGSAKGDIIVESAELGPWENNGPWAYIGPEQFVGTRFHLDNPTEVQQIGGTIAGTGNNSIFGAIVSLNSPTAFPSGNPFDTAPLAVTVFQTQWTPSAYDIRTPLEVTLAPGDYALVFGSGLFGATGTGVASISNIDVPGSSCLVYNNWNPPSASWYNYDPNWTGNGPMRFVVEGVVVPEPGSAALLALGAVLALRRRIRA